MSVLGGFAGDGLAVVEDLCALGRLEACRPPHVPVPKPGPCPGIKRAGKKATDTVKDVTGDKPAKKTAKKTAEPKPPEPAAEPKKTARAKAVPKKTPPPAAPPPAAPPVPQADLSPEVRAAQAHVAKLTAKLPPGIRQEVTDSLMFQATHAPKAMLKLKAVGIGVAPKSSPSNPDASAQYHPQNSAIDLHPNWRNAKAFEERRNQEMADLGVMAPSGAATVLGGIVAHEFGHHLALKSIYRADDIGLRPGGGERLLKTVASAAGIPPPKGNGRGFVPYTELKEWVKKNASALRRASSGFSADTFHEAVAEAWAEYTTMGAAARPFARTVGKTMRSLAGEPVTR